MPRGYRSAHDEGESVEHARVVQERGAAAAHASLLPTSRGAPSALCVVAEDRAGLLATISAALVLSGIDVLDAEAHIRRTPAGRAEAVDLFWVRRADLARRDEPLVPDDCAALARLLSDLLEGRVDPNQARAKDTQPRLAVDTIVRFQEDADGGLTVLEVETGDRSGLLLALARALFEQGVQIEQSEVKTEGDRVRDRFHLLELDGSAITAARRLSIQVAVLGAIDVAKG